MALATRPIGKSLALACLLATVVGLSACMDDAEKISGFMERGNAYKDAEQYEEAIIEYRNVLQLDPNFSDAHGKLAEVYMRTRRYREGYWELSETVRLDEKNIEARLAYATVSLAANRHEEVYEQSNAIIEIDPENAPAFLLRGQALVSLKRMDEVEADLLRAVELMPEDPSYLTVLAAYYNQVGQIEDAEKRLLEAVELGAQPLVHTMLGRIYMGQERYDEAEQAFKQAISSASVRDEEGTQSPELAQGYQNLATYYIQREREEEGIATMERGIEAVDEKLELTQLLSRYYRSQGDVEKANQILEEATQLDPSDPEPFLVVSNLRGRAGDLKGAFEAAEQALAADPEFPQARLRVAELLIDVGVREKDQAKVEAGRQDVEKVLAKDPTNPDALFVRAKFYIASDELDAGIEDLRNAIDVRPEWAQAHFVLGSALLLKGEAQRARAELARSVELQPGLTEARKLLIKIHSDLGEHEYAIENGRRYLSLEPDDDGTRILVAQSMVRLGKLSEAAEMLDGIPEERRGVDAHYALGRLGIAQGDVAGARAELVKADAERPDNPKILSSLLSLDRAEDKLGESIRRINDAVERNPDNAALWELKGTAALVNGDVEGAETALEKAIELDPGAMSAYGQLSRIYAGTGRMDETIALYENVLKLQPENPVAHHFLAVLYEMTGRQDEAVEHYELALEYDPSNGETKNNLAYVLAESGGDLDRALKLAQEAKAAMPDSPSAADTLGWVLYKRGVSSAAVGYLRESVQLAGPNDPALGEIRTHLALAYEASGDRDKAIATLEAALSDLDKRKASGNLNEDPPWAENARASVERLKSAG